MNHPYLCLPFKAPELSLLESPKILKYLLLIAAIFSTGLLSAQNGEEAVESMPDELILKSEVFSRIFTGFALYDPEAETYLYQKDAEKYFTPASNTKLFTLYTALQVLGDSIPALRYTIQGDTLVFWGTGNPLFLHPDLPSQDSSLLHFLKNRPEQLFFSPHNYEDERFGPGWSWRDYSYSYQTEKSPLPLYGNLVRFERKKVREGFDVIPAYFKNHLALNPALNNSRPDVKRQEFSNTFEYNARAMTGIPFERERPFHYEPAVVTGILSDILERPVGILHLGQLSSSPAQTINAYLPDTLYQRLLKDSDNFIAEQLLLSISEKLSGGQQSKRAIQYALDSLFADAPDPLVWKDGSGLSRYNLFTPRSITYALNLIYQMMPEERLFSLFPAGGISGTIEEWYGGRGGTPPYVFAKTGTLSNKHCLSGYLITKSDKVLIFSFMHNNYINNSTNIKKEMETVLEWIRDHH